MYDQSESSFSAEITREFFRSVYSYMFVALGISGTVAYTIGTDERLFIDWFVTPTGMSPLFWVAMFSPLALSFLIQWGYNRLSTSLLMVLFALFSGLMGLSLASIFLVYDMASIATTFFVAAGAFAGMAILGYTTKTDLSKFGSLLYMVFIGMFIAGIVNMFVGNVFFDFILACVGVFVFTGLTAYHMQSLKKVAQSTQMDAESRNKLALIGGLQLYVLFINLFLSLLRIMGGRD
ncbi:MAG: Bax inhibitor-1/YccA family protein [Flavobacteriales bacterium]|jgi:FtsH-binding integral membrane protein|nr:Bax inhibitor-1/YccA family protein [Flavobacteriales bacterium]